MDTATTHVVCPHCGTTNRIPTARLADDPSCGRCGKALLDGRPVELSDADFERVAAATGLPVLVDFWAPWCGPCQQMAPQFEQAARTLKGRALLVKVNSDDNPQTASRFGIRSIPTLIIFKNGKIAQQFVGLQQSAALVQAIEAALK